MQEVNINLNQFSAILNKSTLISGDFYKRKNVTKGLWLVFLVWPFAVFVYSIKNFKKAWASKIFVAFAAFFGFTFVQFGDALRVADQLTLMHDSGIRLQNIFNNYFTGDSELLDLTYSLITFIVAIFTDDYRFLFAILAAAMAYFITKSIWFLVQRTQKRINFFDGLILITLAVTVQLWYIGGRWYLAAIVLIFGILNYFYTDNKKYLWLAGLSFFIHWSFLLVWPVFLTYRYFKNRTLIYYSIFVFSFFLNITNLNDVFLVFTKYAPTAVLETRSSYFNEGYIIEQQEHAQAINWYVDGHSKYLNWLLLLFVSNIYFIGKNKIKHIKPLFNIFNFALLFFGVFQIFSSIPSVFRFLTVGQWLLLAVSFLYIHQVRGRFNPFVKYFGVLIMLLFVIVRIRIGSDAFSMWTFFGNPLFVYWVDNTTPIIDFIKSIF